MIRTAIKLLLLALFTGNAGHAFAQLEKLIVERYYVTDANDATDNTGGGVAEGSVTYRIYADLIPGSILKSIYGDAAHPFSITSTEVFFNHATDGQTFAKEFIKNRYMENTVALDTWLTIGQTAKKQGPVAYYGILKDQDNNGSFIGGDNNDGGSEMITGGLLVNADPSIGMALTTSDGMDTLGIVPDSWFSNGVLDFLSGNDSTIFGSLVAGNNFYSESFSLSNSGVSGTRADSNQVLIAQLTTKGELSFRINLEVETVVDDIPTSHFYVGTNEITNSTEIFNPYLTYPYACGCNDPGYLEYDPAFICNMPGTCLTSIVIGCMDSLACNYDPTVNLHLTELCCYPGWCSNRNIEEVCPQLKGSSFDFTLYPNPTSGNVTLNVINGESSSLEYFLLNSYGVEMRHRTIPGAPLNFIEEIDLSGISPGIYQVKVITDHGFQHQLFVRL